MNKIRIIPFYKALWQNIRPHLGLLLLGTLIASLPSLLVSMLPRNLLFSQIATLGGNVLTLGVLAMLFHAMRGEAVSLRDVTSRFDRTLTMLCCQLLLFLIIAAASLIGVFVFTATLTGTSVAINTPDRALAAFLNSDNMFYQFSLLPPATALTISIILIVFNLALIVTLTIVLLRFSLARAVIADLPGIGATDALRESASLLKGRKRTLFKLDLVLLLAAAVLIFLLQPVLLAAGQWQLLVALPFLVLFLLLLHAVHVQLYLMLTYELEIPQ